MVLPRSKRRRRLQTAPIAHLPIELVFQIFYILLPPVSHIRDLNQEFISHFYILAGICSTFRNIALSILQRYCVLFEDDFSSYTLNISYLRNMAMHHDLMKWQINATLTLGRPFPPSRKSWSLLLDAVAKHSGRRKIQVYNLPWDAFDPPDMLRSIFSLRPASLGLFFENQQTELSLREILSFSSDSFGFMRSVTISGLASSRPGRSREQPFSQIDNSYAQLALLQCGLCDGDFNGILDNHASYHLSMLRFSSFHHLLSAEGFGNMLRIFRPDDLCCAFQQLADSAEENPVSCLRRHIDHELCAWFSHWDGSRHLYYSLYLDGGREDSNLISDTFLEAEGEWDNLEELVLLYCHFSASTVRDFLSNVARIQNSVKRWWGCLHLVVQLKPFFGDCDFSPSWFSRALWPFHSLVAVSSVELFNKRYAYTEYSLQYDPSRSGTVFSVFCKQGKLSLDIWFIDQDDEPGNEDSLFFWENFEANRPLRL